MTVPTPVDQANRPDMTPLVKASETVAAFAATRKPCFLHTFVLISLRLNNERNISKGLFRNSRCFDKVISYRGIKNQTALALIQQN